MNIPKNVFNGSALVHRLLFNKYGLVFFVFFVWMLFFDSKNMFVQHKLSKQIKALEQEKREYVVKYKNVLKEKHDLNSDIEKFAREKFFMHKENEVVFILK
ncbi:MAG TPA: septum formation initiator family protein [Bacteroidetes bacterium]|nr:septum formation initiator family protein [Bacteroidota bacterium]